MPCYGGSRRILSVMSCGISGSSWLRRRRGLTVIPGRDRTGATADVVPSGVPGNTKAERVRAMFARIVPRYDLMNALMTGGLDRRWRDEAALAAVPRGCLALDVGAGTGDLAFALVRAGAAHVVGVDFCEE